MSGPTRRRRNNAEAAGLFHPTCYTSSVILGLGVSPMRRRQFIALLGSGVAGWPLAARAQSERVRRIGILMPYPKDDPEMGIRVRAFREELAKLGWTDGATVQFDERWTADHMDRVWAEAASLIASNPDAILATGGRVIPVLIQLSRSIP